ncbi:hypothetical protein B9N43_13040 [Denitratisoma sp. DHT3]|uniref:glycine zipper 2TM domain-containing protein n=1 Tax=Denitratisoma sp. DHT3 TaxID=1981880 RepID=UPI0011988B46|nr:glycine zipper 2TM domain-containing protein [Denitratisoma sp. DHT3]QDX82090.1 hypothetical protein B9N43_13040 [Denitratisoma sp. DHT3]
MKSIVTFAATATAALVLISGCATSSSGASYSQAQARHEMVVRLGVVEAVRPVQIEGSKSGAGTLTGAVVGGAAGSKVGQGKGSAVAAIVGAVAGGIAGSALEGSATKKDGVEITVRLENNTLIAVTQEADEVFRLGERVRVLSGGGVTRVAH